MKIYKTISGDTWDFIAYKLLGDETYMSDILALNEKYKNMMILPSNLMLNIPDKNSNKVLNLPPWRK